MQVPQQTTVMIEIPRWTLQSGEHGDGVQFRILKRCIPGQRGAASGWNKYSTEICERYDYINFQGTIFKHKNEMAFISVRVDDLLVVGTKEYITKFHSKFAKELKLKIEGPLQCGDDGSIFYLKCELQFVENGICQVRCLQIYDVETTSSEEYLGAEDSKLFRSALGICIHVSQERYDIQHSVHVLATYIAQTYQDFNK